MKTESKNGVMSMEVDNENDMKEITEGQKSFKESIHPKHSSLFTKKPNLPLKSYILSGSDSAQIHEENLNVMKNMTEDEIREEREKLIETLDPAILAYLKSRRKNEVLQNRNPTIKEQNEAAAHVKMEEIETASEILGQPKAEKWLNFDVVEINKLAWMKDIDIPKLKKSEKFEAR